MVLSCNHFGVRLSTTASLQSCLGTALVWHRKPSFGGGNPADSCHTRGHFKRDTLCTAALLQRRKRQIIISNTRSAFVANFCAVNLDFTLTVYGTTLKLQVIVWYLIFRQGWCWRIPVLRDATPDIWQFNVRRSFKGTQHLHLNGFVSSMVHYTPLDLSHKARISIRRLLVFGRLASRILSTNIDHHIAICRILLLGAIASPAWAAHPWRRPAQHKKLLNTTVKQQDSWGGTGSQGIPNMLRNSVALFNIGRNVSRCGDLAMSQEASLRPLTAKPRFLSQASHVWFAVNTWYWDRIFSPPASVFSCHYLSTNVTELIR